MQMLVALAAICAVSYAAPGINWTTLREPDHRAGYVLDDTWYPWSYNVTIKPDFPVGPETDVITFSGEVSMEAIFGKNVKQIPIHAGNNLRIVSVKLVYPYPSGNEIAIASTQRDEEHELLLINVDGTMIEARVIATIQYTATIVSGMEGFFKTSYKVDGKERLFMGTHLAPTLARYAFPCLDEPRFKATFVVSVYVPSGYSALSNAPLDERSTRTGSEFSLYVFKKTPAIPPHLVSLVMFEEDSYSSTPFGITTLSGVTFFAWAPKTEIAAGRAAHSMSIGYQALGQLEDYLGSPYIDGNITQVDLAVTPNLVASHIDTAGVLEFKANNLLVDPETGTQRDKQLVEETVSFLLAQQWFGRRVTPGEWTYAWLSDGISRFLQYYAVGQLHSDWRLDERFFVEQQQRAFVQDALVSAPALISSVQSPVDIREKIDSPITAAKGAAILYALRYAMGEENLKKSLAEFIDIKDHGTATNSDLATRLTANSPGNVTLHITISALLSSWTSQPGFPVVTFKRDYSARTGIPSQARFIGNGQPQTTVYTYYFPLSVFSAGNYWPMRWLDNSIQQPFKDFSSSTWVLLNNTGYFRVNYDATNWALLSDQLRTDHEALSPVDRARLVDDVLALARAGVVSYEVALSLVSYLERETDYVAWTAAFNALHFLRRMLGAYDTDDALKNYVLELLGTVYAQMGFASSGSHLDKLLRARVVQWACLAGDTDCIDDAQTRFNAYVQTGSSVDPDLRRAIYCVGIRHGTDNDWQHLWNTLPSVTNPSERSDILYALGCTQNSNTLDSYLEDSLELAPPDAADALYAIFSNPIALTTALDFLIDRFRTVVDVFGGVRAAVNAVNGISNYITTDADALKVRRLAEAYPELGSVSTNAYSIATDNAAWVRLYKDEVLALLAAQTLRMRTERALAPPSQQVAQFSN